MWCNPHLQIGQPLTLSFWHLPVPVLVQLILFVCVCVCHSSLNELCGMQTKSNGVALHYVEAKNKGCPI